MVPSPRTAQSTIAAIGHLLFACAGEATVVVFDVDAVAIILPLGTSKGILELSLFGK